MEDARPAPRRPLRVVLLAAVGVGAFLLAWKWIAPGGASDLALRARPGDRALYLEEPLAAQLLATLERAHALERPEFGVPRMAGTALARLEDPDWAVAMDLVRFGRAALEALADRGRAGIRPRTPAEKLVARRAELEALRERFATSERLRHGEVPEAMDAYLGALSETLAALDAVLRDPG